jgi:hypothetical protein
MFTNQETNIFIVDKRLTMQTTQKPDTRFSRTKSITPEHRWQNLVQNTSATKASVTKPLCDSTGKYE